MEVSVDLPDFIAVLARVAPLGTMQHHFLFVRDSWIAVLEHSCRAQKGKGAA